MTMSLQTFLAEEAFDGIPTRILRMGKESRTVVLIGPGIFNDAGFCWNLHAWERNFFALAENFSIIAFDTLGQGGTSFGPGSDAFTYDRALAHAKAVLEKVASNDLHIVAHDQGALIALHLAMSFTDRVRSCTVVSAPSVIAAPGEDVANFVTGLLPAPIYSFASQEWVLDRLSVAADHIRDGEFLNDATRPRVHDTPSEDAVHTQLRPSLRRFRAEVYKCMQNKGLNIPILVLWGRDDPVKSLDYGSALFDLIKTTHRETQFCVLNRCGYFPYREQAKAFNNRVMGFIRSV
jgi:pimeloyl-ACP methyl ester carboxylesterase